MSMYYANESDETSPYTLPSVWITQFTALEIAETMADDIYAFSKRPAFRLASMNGRVRDAMLEAIVDELEITGGFMWCVCLPGCLPDSDWTGPFATEADALADARDVLAD